MFISCFLFQMVPQHHCSPMVCDGPEADAQSHFQADIHLP